ncbi:MAG: hypothetical protein QM689_12435 [Oscillospiraceae bacterium]
MIGERIWLCFKMIVEGFISISIGTAVYIFFKTRKRKILKNVPTETRIEILRKYSGYDNNEVAIRHHAYIVLKNPAPEILLKYNYARYRSENFKNKDDIVFAMLDFVCDNFKHIGNAAIKGSHSLTGIISSCEKTDLRTNCRGLSLMLAELLRINGIKARHVTCKPYEEPFSDCHVVVDCLMPSGERIMLDPTYRLYFTDDNGKYVSLAQLREGIINGRHFYPNADASYNAEAFSYDNYIEYMSKNTLRLNTNYRLNDTDSILSEIELIPCGYSVAGYPKVVQYTTNADYFWNME